MTASAKGRRARLLVVDRHADTAESLQLVLDMLGYTVDVALDAATALTLAARQPFALGFVGINLPDVDGYTLAGRLRTIGNPRVLVALTGHGSPRDLERATAAGFHDHVLKPAGVAQLENVLTRFLASDPA
jgi:CheY-like chemotaxis protein